jgi:mevalonate kinase
MSLRFSYSFPGKVILFGEHAVVHGQTAVSSAISKRMSADCNFYKSMGTLVNVVFQDKTIAFNPYDDAPPNATDTSKMIRHAFNGIFPKNHTLDINIIQRFPTGGLGSSAALCGCIAAASNRIGGLDMSKDAIFKKSFELEKFFHGNPSGIDPATVVYGGCIKMENRKLERIEIPNVPLLIVSTKREHSTKVAVNRVKELMKKYPDVYPPIIKSMGDISKAFLGAPNDKKADVMADLFTPAHHLLSSFGLSCPESDEICSIAEGNGLSAKISGAGMGGIMLVTGKDVVKKARLFSKYSVISATIGAQGMMEI